MRLRLYSDGGARGNPGPAAVAFLALAGTGQTIRASSRYIGVHTNNQAEYNALIDALKFATADKVEEVICHLDSELVVKQLNGEYSVKNPELRKLWLTVRDLRLCFKKISFVNVPRSDPYITRADALVNHTLDEKSKGSQLNDYYEPVQTVNLQTVEENKVLFVHTSIRTRNMEKSIDFYTRLLNLKLLSRREIKQTNAEIAFLQDPEGKGCTLELTFYKNQRKFEQPDYENRLFDHLGFTVSSMDDTLDALRKENIVVSDEPFKLGPDGPTIAFIEDPDGTLIELIEH